jgi:hypothetical protein
MGAGTPGMTGTRGIASGPVAPPSPRARLAMRLAILAAAAAIVLGLVGVAVWAALDPGRYASSGDGCVTLTIASSTGGAVLHACGDQARVMCAAAFASEDRIALLTRPQCEIAGLAPALRD